MREIIKEELDNLKKLKAYEKILQGRIEEIDGKLMLVSDGRYLGEQIQFLRNDYLGDIGINHIKLELDTSSEDEKERFLLKCFNGMVLILKIKNREYLNSILWFKGNEVWCEQDLKYKIFWLSYRNIWLDFEHQFRMGYIDIQVFIMNVLEERFKLGSLTPINKTLAFGL